MNRIFLFIVLALTSCKPADIKTPEGAFASIAECIDKADARCLYTKLDRDGLWSIQTIHRTLGRIKELVERSYPAPLRRTVYSTWFEEAEASGSAALFEVYCGKRRCLELVAQGFGAVVETTSSGQNAVNIKTTRGQTFEMVWAEDRWGLTLFTSDLQKAKLRLIDRLVEVKKNAAEFDEQRLAGGELEAVPERKKESEHEH